MKTYQFEASAARYRRLGASLMVILGTDLGHLYEAPASGPGAASLGRGPYYEDTPLASPAPELAAALPSGVTRTATGLLVSEPDAGFGSAYFAPFDDREADLSAYLTPDHGRVELVGGWDGPVAVEPANSVLVGLVNPTTLEFSGCGVIGSGMSGTSGGLGAAVKLGLDPVRVSLGPLARRRVALRWAPADLLGVPGVLLDVVYSDPSGSGDPSSLQSETLSAASRADWRAFLAHPDTQPGIVVTQDSMGPGSAATPALLERLIICP